LAIDDRKERMELASIAKNYVETSPQGTSPRGDGY
jgi:hypothetical protein